MGQEEVSAETPEIFVQIEVVADAPMRDNVKLPSFVYPLRAPEANTVAPIKPTLPVLVTPVIMWRNLLRKYPPDDVFQLDSLEVNFFEVYRNLDYLAVLEITDVIEVRKDVARAIIPANYTNMKVVRLLKIFLDIDNDRLHLAYGNFFWFYFRCIQET